MNKPLVNNLLQTDPFTNTPLVTLNSLGKNVKRIFLARKAEIFGKINMQWKNIKMVTKKFE